MAADDDIMRDELAAMQMRANQITDKSLESTSRMVGLIEETRNAGIGTLVMLDEQGEQLNRIDEGMDQINQDMKQAEKNLDSLENKAKKIEKGGENKKAFSKKQDNKFVANHPRARVQDERTMVQVGGGYVKKVTNDAREDEMEENLTQVAGVIENLKHIATDMGNKISSQNNQLDKINTKAEVNEGRIDAANERAAKILKS